MALRTRGVIAHRVNHPVKNAGWRNTPRPPIQKNCRPQARWGKRATEGLNSLWLGHEAQPRTHGRDSKEKLHKVPQDPKEGFPEITSERPPEGLQSVTDVAQAFRFFIFYFYFAKMELSKGGRS